MSRLKQIAQQASDSDRKLLIPYLVAGDPDLDTTSQLMDELVEQGADIIELGIPFSDPASDGPVIQLGVERALAAGVSLQDTLALVRKFREKNDSTGIVLMGYLNPVEIMGYELFVENAQEAGVDGVLIVDMPPTESAALHDKLRAADIDTIYLVAPTTGQNRAAAIVERCSGYLYYVSLKGVTGAALSDQESVAAKIAELRELTDLPIVIGFGIKDAKSAQAMAVHAEGVIIGSALVQQIGEMSKGDSDGLQESCAIIGEAREALDKMK